MMLTMTNGDKYEAVHDFGNDRAIVNMEGLYVFVDRVSADVWELSGEPARPGNEQQVHVALVKALEAEGTTVKVTPPDSAL